MEDRSFNIIRALMIKDGSLDSEILEVEAELKRDITIEEEKKIVSDMVEECKKRQIDLSCSIIEAYKDIMY